MKKEIKPIMKFNTALMKFEPDVESTEKNGGGEIKVNWKWIIGIVLLIIVISVLSVLRYMSK
jgi:hypothetical protein